MATSKIICGDNLEVMRDMPDNSFDLIFTSPPYNMGNTTGGGLHATNRDAPSSRWKRSDFGPAYGPGYDEYHDNMPWPEYTAWQHEVLRECWRLLSNKGAIYYNHKPRVQALRAVLPTEFIPPELTVRQIVIWRRNGGLSWNHAFYASTHEWLVVIAKEGFRLRDQSASGEGDVWSITAERDNPHPAPFPLELPLRALRTTKTTRVLDPFCGSGTTGVACARMNIDFVGIDVSPLYCGWAETNIRKAQGIGDQSLMPLYEAV
jgi:site-specific DNA-methyltransferase (adenine-specific)